MTSRATIHHLEEAQATGDPEGVENLDVPILLVDLPEAKILLSTHADKGLRSWQIPDHLDCLSVYCKSAVKLVQLTNMEQIDGTLTHSKSKELLEAILWAPDVSNSGQMQPLVQDLSIEGWDVLFALCANKLHRDDLLHHHWLVFSISELTLLKDLLKEGGLSVNLVDAE